MTLKSEKNEHDLQNSFFFFWKRYMVKRTYTAFDSLLLEWDINDPREVEQVWMSEKKNKFWSSLSS